MEPLDSLSIAIGCAGGLLVGAGVGYKVGYDRGYREGVKKADNIIDEIGKKVEDRIDAKFKELSEKTSLLEKYSKQKKALPSRNDKLDSIFQEAE